MFIQVVTTTPDQDQALRIARAAVKARLAACAQVAGPIHSIYRWEGQVEQAQEWLCILKSASHLFPALEALICRHHPYQVPEILAVPVAAGHQPYLDWLQAALTEE